MLAGDRQLLVSALISQKGVPTITAMSFQAGKMAHCSSIDFKTINSLMNADGLANFPMENHI